jgi:hypothetical protein
MPSVPGDAERAETKDGLEIKTYREFALHPADGITQELHNIRRLFSSW